MRIGLTLAAALLVMGGSQGYLLWEQREAARSTELLLTTWVPLSRVVDRLQAYEQRVSSDLQRLVRNEVRAPEGARAPLDVYREQLDLTLAEGRVQAREALESGLSGEDRAVFQRVLAQIDRMDALFSGFQRGGDELLALQRGGDEERARQRAQALLRDSARLQEEIGSLGRLVDDRVDGLAGSIRSAQARGGVVAALLTALALALAVLAGAVVLLALRPIGRLTTEVQRLASGDYGGRVEARGGDEIAVLAEEFNAMAQVLEGRDRALVERAEELNRLSRYLGSVLDSLQDGLFVVEDHRVSLANPASEGEWGVILGEEPPRWLSALREGSHDLVAPDQRRVRVGVIPFGPGGQVVLCSDVTAESVAAERLSRSERLALVGQMLAQITHEVRNPLNALSLNAELLGDELRDMDPDRGTEAWEILDTISHEVDRLTSVTGHYLQLARRPAARLTPTALGEVVDEVARLLRPELQRDGAALQVTIEPLPPVSVDANQVRQALLNVVRNAVEAGGRALVLSLSRQGDEVRLTLADDGPGMSEEEVARATDPFFSTKATGTGLGLAITRQILEDHHGAVEISSQPGRGTVLALVFPATTP